MADRDKASDETLLARVAASDAEALGVLFDRHQRTVYRFALHLTGAPAVADDVTQDVFIAVLRDAHRFDAGRASVAAWLCGIARNFVRRRVAGARDEPLDEDVDLPALGADPLGDLTQAEQVEKLRQAILNLPMRYREALVLCDLQEMPYADAAGALGCPVGTVRSRLHRARALLIQKMQAELKNDRTSAA